MTIDFDTPWILHLIPLLSYAEIHYRIWNFWSRYFRREPEIVADMPHRVGPGRKLPVVVCIKDADRYPIRLDRIAIHLVGAQNRTLLLQKEYESMAISEPLWYDILPCDVERFSGRGKIIVNVFYSNKRQKMCVNDNYRLTSHAPFNVLIDPQPRPRLDGWVCGDMHTHSHFTSDQVEFGAPLEVSSAMSSALELDFFAATDHSYDLDDSPQDYLVNDPERPNWNMLWEQVRRLNEANENVVILPGEELSVGNAKNRNVHMLLLNNHEFFSGSGDSAERWFRTRPQHRIPNVLARLESSALAIAAHPLADPPLAQKLLIRRGTWTDHDLKQACLHGCQFWNGDKEHFLKIGLPKWIELLLDGHRITLIAGTDAHGNFNRFRQIGTPHLTMQEGSREVFGTCVTGVYVGGESSLDAILSGLRRGCAIVTDGPMATMAFTPSSVGPHPDAQAGLRQSPAARHPMPAGDEKCKRIGETARTTVGAVRIDVRSSPNYGNVRALSLIVGDIEGKKETRRRVDYPSGLYRFTKNVALQDCPQPGYLRLELETCTGERLFHCFTNPIYFD